MSHLAIKQKQKKIVYVNVNYLLPRPENYCFDNQPTDWKQL